MGIFSLTGDTPIASSHVNCESRVPDGSHYHSSYGTPCEGKFPGVSAVLSSVSFRKSLIRSVKRTKSLNSTSRSEKAIPSSILPYLWTTIFLNLRMAISLSEVSESMIPSVPRFWITSSSLEGMPGAKSALITGYMSKTFSITYSRCLHTPSFTIPKEKKFSNMVSQVLVNHIQTFFYFNNLEIHYDIPYSAFLQRIASFPI